MLRFSAVIHHSKMIAMNTTIIIHHWKAMTETRRCSS